MFELLLKALKRQKEAKRAMEEAERLAGLLMGPGTSAEVMAAALDRSRRAECAFHGASVLTSTLFEASEDEIVAFLSEVSP